MWVFNIVALLRCLFREQNSRIRPSQL